MSDIICELVPESVFTLRVGEVVMPGFREIGRWEGFRKLKDDRGRVIIVCNQSPGGSFAETFDALTRDDSAPLRMVIVQASPELFALINSPLQAAVRAAKAVA